MIYGDMEVPSKFIQDRAAQVTNIIKLLNKIKFNIEYQLERGHSKIRALFIQNLNPHLMIQYNKEAKEARIQS